MAAEVTKQDQALTRGAGLVSGAREDLEGKLSDLRGKLAGIGAQWQGTGSAAFTAAMTRWDENARTITSALNDFEANLRTSEQDYNTADDAQAQVFSNLQSRLG